MPAGYFVNGTLATIYIGQGTGPRYLALTHDGSKLYVGCSTSGEVVPIDVATGIPGDPITVGAGPYSLQITPDGTTLYVGCGGGELWPIDVATDVAGAPFVVSGGPVDLQGMAITPDGTAVYLPNFADATVIPVAIPSGVPDTPISVGFNPDAAAITPDGAKCYVANEGETTLTPIDIASGIPGTPITVGDGTVSLLISSDGSTLYSAGADGAVTVVDTATDLATATIPIAAGGAIHDLAFSVDESILYAMQIIPPEAIYPVTVADQVRGGPIPVGPNPGGLAVRPDGIIYCSSQDDDNVSLVVNIPYFAPA
jgi:DNA-binding beta-propeller fold protein YncE